MKLLLIAFAVIAAVAADVSHLPSNEYLPPVQESAPAPAPAPSSEYLPPVQQAAAPAPVEAAPAHELADDGYRYKTHRRVVYRRHRRDVSHLPSNEYLPPGQESAPAPVQAPSNEYLAPVQEAPAPAPVEAAPAHELADDGYRYKTHRRVVYRRQRRDVSHLPSNEYLPPVQESAPVPAPAPSNEYLPPVQHAPAPAPVEAAPAHELADDGYRYKTHRRVVYRRHRRDVSHLPSNEYLPPGQESAPAPVQAPSNEYLAPVQEAPAPAPVEAAPAHELADDGYRYKTHRRVVYRRHRRDVSHLPSNEYLPPGQESAPAPVQAPSNEYLAPVQEAPVEAAPAHELADDGYRYKTHRRVVYRRQRRDVSHLPSNEYLPPVHESAPVPAPAPSNEYLPPVQHAPAPAPVEAAPAHELADDGYRYKTHRRVVYRRQRRDVSHLPSNEYLPPVQESAPAPVQAPSNEYLPPVQHAPAPAPVEAAPAHELADDGYRYKTHRRVVYRRHRRDVSHLPSNEYLPPGQESAPAPVQAPSNEYLAPVQEAPVEAAPAHELADDGYRYKTHRRVVYRRH